MFTHLKAPMKIASLASLLTLTGACLLAAQPALAQQKLVPANSSISFVTKQMGVPLEGQFKKFDAQVVFNPAQLASSHITLNVDTGSATFEVIQQFYIELPIQVKVFGSYHDLATFVSAVAGMPRIVTLHDFSIKPVVEGNSSRLAMNILVKTYRYNDQGAKQ